MKLKNFLPKKIFIVVIVIFLILASIGISFYLSNKQKSIQENQATHSPCLENNEIVFFEFIGDLHEATSANVIINDKNNGKEIFRFKIDNLVPNRYSYELHQCSVYVIREFNYDIKTRRATPGYRIELWKYDYDSRDKNVLLFSETDSLGQYTSYFNDNFRIDSLEIYVALEQRKSYLGESSYALVIRNFIENLNVFSLKHTDLLNQYPNLSGLFGLLKWTKSGDYFWGNIFDGAIINAFVQITRDTWLVNIFQVPDGTEGGTAFNPEYGYVTYDTGPGWIGIDVVAEQIYDEWRKEGKKVDFYLYNLFTQEKTLLATTDDPSWSFKPQWLSDIELQYELPSGEKKIYKIADE